MRYIEHESGEAGKLKNAQIIGDDSPAEFDEDGRAGPFDDRVAELLAGMHAHIELGGRADEQPDGYDAEHLSTLSRDELYNLAQDEDIEGRSGMTKNELIDALED
jgi:hypothetical protein